MIVSISFKQLHPKINVSSFIGQNLLSVSKTMTSTRLHLFFKSFELKYFWTDLFFFVFCLMMDQSSTDLRYFDITGFDRGRTSNLLKSSSFLSSFLFAFSFVFSFFKEQRNPFCWKAFFVLIKGQLQNI